MLRFSNQLPERNSARFALLDFASFSPRISIDKNSKMDYATPDIYHNCHMSEEVDSYGDHEERLFNPFRRLGIGGCAVLPGRESGSGEGLRRRDQQDAARNDGKAGNHGLLLLLRGMRPDLQRRQEHGKSLQYRRGPRTPDQRGLALRQGRRLLRSHRVQQVSASQGPLPGPHERPMGREELGLGSR